MTDDSFAAAAPERSGWMREVDWRATVKWGFIAGAVLVFVSIIGMVEAFSERNVVDPILSLGYAALLWIPVSFGFKASFRPTIEGLPEPKTGVHNLVAGATTGLISGGVLAALVLFINEFDVREIFTNVSPRLLELLTFEESVGFGVGAWLVIGLLLGAAGGALVVLPVRWRKAVLNGVLWVFVIGLMEVIVGQILTGLDTAPGIGRVLPDMSFLDEAIYSDQRGLTLGAAIAFFLIAFGLSYAFGERRKQWRAKVEAMPPERKRTAGLVAAVVLVALAFILPNIFGSFLNEIMATVGLFLLMGLGLNVVIGFAGLLDLGYVAFFAVGAYTTAVLTSPISPKIAPAWPIWLAIPFVLLAAAVAGIIVGTPVIRMRGDYLAIVTLGFGEIARILLRADWLKPVLGGAQGILQISWDPEQLANVITIREIYVEIGLTLLAAVIGFSLVRFVWNTRRVAAAGSGPGAARAWGTSDRQFLIAALIAAAVAGVIGWLIGAGIGDVLVFGTNTKAMFFLILVFVAIAAYVSIRLQDSRIGRAWMAMREDEQVAEAMGINIVTAKLLAFVIGAILASLGGALFAAKIGSVFPSSFELIVSIIVLVLIIVGGMGSIPGVFVGAFVLIGVLGGPTQPGLLREFEEFKLLIYGAVLIYMMLKRPEGLLPSARRSRELHQDEVRQDAWFQAKDEEAAEAEA